MDSADSDKKVYDLGFGESADDLLDMPEGDPIDLPGARIAGWCGGRAPAIGAASWPRSRRSGQPMAHVLTLALPNSYGGTSAFSLFQADDFDESDNSEISELLDGATVEETFGEDVDEEDVEFLAAVAAAGAERRSRQDDIENEYGGSFAIIQLDAEEFRGLRINPPADVDPESEPEVTVWIGERVGDPNAGIAPIDSGYVPAWSSDDPQLNEFWKSVSGRSHVGGTMMPCQELPDGLGLGTLELQSGVGGANFGDGNAQIEPYSGTIHWAC